MQHINSMAYSRKHNRFVLGDKRGTVALVHPSNLGIVHRVSIGSSTIQAITINESTELVATLNKNFTISLFKIFEDSLIASGSINCLEHMVEDGYRVAFSESQEIALSPNGRRLSANGPTGQTLIFEFDDRYGIASWRALRHESSSAPVTSVWVTDTVLLVGQGDGSIVKYDYEEDYQVSTRLNGINETVHWFEKETDDTYLLATDARRLVRLNARTLGYKIGPVFSNDDFEHVTIEPSSGKIFASSFDRNVYLIDSATLAPIATSFKAPFKLRWIKAIREATGVKLYLQIRNGSFLKVDVDTQKVEAAIHTAKPALWSATYWNGDLVIGGEYGLYRVQDRTIAAWNIRHSAKLVPDGSYIKRLISCGERMAYGTTGATVHFVSPGSIERCDVGAPVRDLDFATPDTVLACLEDGRLIEIRWAQPGRFRTLFRSGSEPLWSLAVSPNQDMVAVGERMGRIVFLKLNSSGDVEEVVDTSSRIPKRMKWFDRDTLLVVHSGAIDRISRVNGEWSHEENFFNGNANTVEDFLVLENGKFLVGITYNKIIIVWDVRTGELLSSSYWDFDYAKGMIRDCDSDCEFFVYGRDMVLKKFRLHDAQVICMDVFDRTFVLRNEIGSGEPEHLGVDHA
jgi:WD40 repeat protein